MQAVPQERMLVKKQKINMFKKWIYFVWNWNLINFCNFTSTRVNLSFESVLSILYQNPNIRVLCWGEKSLCCHNGPLVSSVIGRLNLNFSQLEFWKLLVRVRMGAFYLWTQLSIFSSPTFVLIVSVFIAFPSCLFLFSLFL